MAVTRMTLDEALAKAPDVDRAKVDATTEADIRRHMAEDGVDPDAAAAPRPEGWYPSVASLRRRLGMTQERFAEAIRVPVATLRNWEQHRVEPDPAAKALLWIIHREPEAALRALAA